MTLPGADAKTVAGLTAQVEAAGGAVAGDVRRPAALVDPGEKSLVDTLGSQLMTQLGGGIADAGAPTYVRMGQLLGLAVATTTADARRVDDAAPRSGRRLAGAELRRRPEGAAQRSPLVLVVLGDDTDDDVLAGLPSGPGRRRRTGVVVVGDTAAGHSAATWPGCGAELAAEASRPSTGPSTALGQVTADAGPDPVARTRRAARSVRRVRTEPYPSGRMESREATDAHQARIRHRRRRLLARQGPDGLAASAAS